MKDRMEFPSCTNPVSDGIMQSPTQLRCTNYTNEGGMAQLCKVNLKIKKPARWRHNVANGYRCTFYVISIQSTSTLAANAAKLFTII